MNLILKKKKFPVRAFSKIAWILLLILPFTLQAQETSRLLQKADLWYEAYNYNRALEAYLKIEKRGESVYYVTSKIADCYRILDKPLNAVEWYKKATAFPDVEKDTYYHLGKELKKLKMYDEAEDNMARYRELSGKPASINGLSTADYLYTIRQDSALWTIFNLSINSPLSEFGPTTYNNKLVFSSNRTDRGIINMRDVRNRQPFYDLYAAELLDFDAFGQVVPFAPKVWSSLNDGPVTFSADGLRLFVTTNVQSSGKNQEQHLDIVVYNLQKGDWNSRPSLLPLRERGFSIMHPVFSPDEKKLYFASDMPGGEGGIDLYYSEQRSGFLSSPVNMGPKINSPGNEVFPFISHNGNLYFSSDGHPGLGGLDIFMAQKEDDGFSKPFNAGSPLNSPFDDFSIWLTPDETSGYMASNRPGGEGSDDLYAFSRTRSLEFVHLEGTVLDEETKEPLDQVYITVTSNGLKSGEWITGKNGSFEVYLKKGHNWQLSFMKRLYKPVEKTPGIDVPGDDKKMVLEVMMK